MIVYAKKNPLPTAVPTVSFYRHNSVYSCQTATPLNTFII